VQWVPLFQDGRLNTGTFDLPVSLDTLPESYFYLSPQVRGLYLSTLYCAQVNLPGLKWLDNHRSVFQVRLAVSTTVHTLDAHLDALLELYHMAKSGQKHVSDEELTLAVRFEHSTTSSDCVQLQQPEQSTARATCSLSAGRVRNTLRHVCQPDRE
jgi:hypothetical protein